MPRMNVPVRALILSVALVLAAAAPAAAREAVVQLVRRHGDPRHLPSCGGAEGRAQGADDPADPRLGRQPREEPGRREQRGHGNVGVGPLRKAGFNVLTWDSRGFGESGGTVTVDSKDNEGRDVQALLDWLADQPEATLDGPDDPRVGMHGVSYAGGIELVAGGDRRPDRRDRARHRVALAPDRASTRRRRSRAAGRRALGLYAAGQASGRLDPHIGSAFTSGTTTGKLSAEDRAWFESRGPGDALVKRIRVPTLLLQGTADTLFTTTEAIRNYEILRRNRVPVKMMWFCGGHGTCLTGTGPAGHFEARVIAWLRKYVAMRRSTPTGPGFEWLADDAVWRSSPSWPPPPGAPLVAEGSGTLALTPLDAVSGTPVAAGPAANAVNVPIPAPAAAQVVGEPQLRLTYSGTGTATHVFAQIVDDKRNLVLGNHVTPLPVTLDGADVGGTSSSAPSIKTSIVSPSITRTTRAFTTASPGGSSSPACDPHPVNAATVRCNGMVRFDAMLALADRLGADALVTGHYARIARDAGGALLVRAVDERKDQTYMLSALSPELLGRVRFPLGELRKSRGEGPGPLTRLPVAEKKESQDLCFMAGTTRERVPFASFGGPRPGRRGGRPPRPRARPPSRPPALHGRPAPRSRSGFA